MKIKKSQLALGLTTLAIIGAVGLSSSVLAASDTNNGFGSGKNRTERPVLSEEQKADMETRRVEMETKMTAINAALEASDYNAWVAAVGSDCPMLEKITISNFSRYVEAHKLHQQEKKIMEELGVEKLNNGHGFGLGKGMGKGMGRGFNK